MLIFSRKLFLKKLCAHFHETSDKPFPKMNRNRKFSIYIFSVNINIIYYMYMYMEKIITIMFVVVKI